MSSRLPLLLLDVDGVLNPYAAPACPPGYTEHGFFPGEDPVRLSAAHGPWLRELATRFQIVWATAWGAEANRLLAPLLQIPDLPVIGFPPAPFHPRDKLPPIIRFARGRPLTWIDDTLSAEAHEWAAKRRIPTLLIDIDPAEGLTRPVVDQSLRWADDQPAEGLLPGDQPLPAELVATGTDGRNRVAISSSLTRWSGRHHSPFLSKNPFMPNGRWFHGQIAVKPAVTAAAFPALSVTTPW